MILQNIHTVSVSRERIEVKRIDCLTVTSKTGAMTTSDKTTLVLGGTGKTGSRVAKKLHELGHGVRTAARHGGDVGFDWDDPATHEGALSGVALVYLVAPVLRVDFAPHLSAFLDLAESRGVRHVTYLSVYGMEHAPSEIALRVVELDLMGPTRFTHSDRAPRVVHAELQ